MSTRANVIVVSQDGSRKQFYHHTDGYPEWMGKMLDNFYFTAYVCSDSFHDSMAKEKMFFELMEREGNFESEELGDVHGDIEYLWIVKFSKDGEADVISYEPLRFGWDYDKERMNGIVNLAMTGTRASEIYSSH